MYVKLSAVKMDSWSSHKTESGRSRSLFPSNMLYRKMSRKAMLHFGYLQKLDFLPARRGWNCRFTRQDHRNIVCHKSSCEKYQRKNNLFHNLFRMHYKTFMKYWMYNNYIKLMQTCHMVCIHSVVRNHL